MADAAYDDAYDDYNADVAVVVVVDADDADVVADDADDILIREFCCLM